MIPGLVSRLSEQVVSLTNTLGPVTADCVKVSSTATTTVLVTLLTKFPAQNAICVLINTSGAAITATTAGNIATTVSIPNNNMCTFVWSKSAGKWYADKTT